MDFAPYQSSPPEHDRAFSPPPGRDGTGSPMPTRASREHPRSKGFSPPPLQHPQPQRAWSGDGLTSPVGGPDSYQSPTGRDGGRGGMGDYFGALGARDGLVSDFNTTLGIRLDYEACLAYLALPPLGAIILLMAERNSDYVRFHAWQSALLFTLLFVVHLIFSWSTFMSWLLFVVDVVTMAWLTVRAYRDADTLDRFEVPLVGRIASGILDDE